ncbi:MAG: hypothetical protein PHE51_06290 [Eubacteriales bacterium]|nr:hypothetical protein [Eubacteriales bacterium]
MKKIVLLTMVLLCINLSACSLQASEPQLIEDAVQFSRITTDELVAIMGEPIGKEDWTYNDKQPVTTYSYDKNSNHYEFIIAENSVVRLTIYSSDSWNGEGEKFKFYGSKQNICKDYNIELGDNAKKAADTNFAYRLRTVNDIVADFWVLDMDLDSKTYGFVKITYDLNYFD